MMYYVVFENIGKNTKGIRSWMEYDTEQHFKEQHSTRMQAEYEVVQAGVTQEEAERLCSTPLDNIKVLSGQLQMLSNQIQRRGED